MRSLLIVGGRPELRNKKLEALIQTYQADLLDRFVLEALRQKIGIDQIRQLQRQLSLKPYCSKTQIAIIPEAEKLTIPAQNAMLKLLEEPPANTIIILSAPTPERLLPTVVSRCQIISLQPTKFKIKKEVRSQQINLARAICQSRVGERLKIAGEMATSRDQAIHFCQVQLFIWRQQMLKENKKERQVKIVAVIRQLQQALRMLEANVNPKLIVENLLLHYPAPPSTPGVE